MYKAQGHHWSTGKKNKRQTAGVSLKIMFALNPNTLAFTHL